MEWVIGLICVVLVIAVVAGVIAAMYNGLVRARNGYRNALRPDRCAADPAA
jgi:hypothetical protein